MNDDVERIGAAMLIASRQFERDVRFNELTDDEIRTLARAALSAMQGWRAIEGAREVLSSLHTFLTDFAAADLSQSAADTVDLGMVYQQVAERFHAKRLQAMLDTLPPPPVRP